ncbi:MAG: chemotaxis protein CheW [Thermodesulfovibrionales bacterium]
MDIAKIRKKMRKTKATVIYPTEAGSLKNDKIFEGASDEGLKKESSEQQGIPSVLEMQTEEPSGISKEVVLSPQTVESQVSETHEGAFSEKTTQQEVSEITSEEMESERIDLLVFKLAGEEYSFILEDVKEILKKQHITPVPLAPPSVLGITSLRGTVIPVIDLSRKLLGIPSKNDRRSRILIMEGKEGTIGCKVDEVEGVQRCSREQKKEIPENMTDKERAFIEAIFVVDDRFITLLKKEIIELKPGFADRNI